MAVTKGNIPGLCITDNPFTGNERCAKTEGDLRAIILTDRAARYPLDAATFEAALQGYVYDNTLQRMYPIKDVISFDPTGNETETSDLGNGYVVPIRNNQYVTTIRLDGGDCLLKELMKFNGRPMRAFRVDDQNYVYGTVVTGNDGDDMFAGFKVTPWVRNVGQTGTDAYALYLELYYTIDYRQEQSNMNAIALSGDALPDGLVPVIFDGQHVIGRCSGVDYTQQYGSEWTAAMFLNASGANPTELTYNSATNTLTLTPTAAYRVADAAALAALGIYGISGVPLAE